MKLNKTESNKSLSKLLFFTLLILTFSLTLSACKKDEEKEAEETGEVEEYTPPTREEILQNMDRVENNPAIGAQADLPEDFPSDAFFIENGRRTLVLRDEQEDGMFFSVVIESDELVEPVAEKYKTGMKDLGWSVDGEVENNGDLVISFVKDGRAASVSLKDIDLMTKITLYIQQ